MKFLFDIFPVLLFFITFKWGESQPAAAQAYVDHYLSGLVSGGVSEAAIAPILLATAITLLASMVQIGYLLVSRKKVDAMLWISFIIIMVFGGATIYFHSEAFIKWKPTVLYWCYAGAFLLAQFVFKKNLIRTAMAAQLTLPEPLWGRLSLAWIAYFVAMGILNLFVAFNFSTATWANFKLISMLAIMPAFIIAQSVFLSKYMEESK
ncbi:MULTISPECIES: septation protein A [unclassified Undibacterium]|uniref:septation protein A n=1 Tax=unclassified Undibacterium TaxID=2630295 RepID=UPI002AC94C5B|nr:MULTISPECIES: septation protein A [unclassified Undibacterium]MEB0141057.1 septation protein A [Undibacterium sp. CCC2.1]MEB0174031.1 septation protein A [Undibacterium sp. CCC1.1]MEB0178000.1 septation protein A [Undibacterium sp. CCC3.4]MEB0217228.1 septation protein A [Undibacterium sp. 5I2]WPX43281.1 septation protein A [Undibacterium sp. CCC3.4]